MAADANLLDRITSVASKALVHLACICVVLMALHVTIDVLLRETGPLADLSPGLRRAADAAFGGLIGKGIDGTTEIVAFYYMIACVCLPLAYLELRDEHITVEVFFDFLPAWLKSVVFGFSIVATGTFFSLFAYRSWLDALSALSTRETVMGYAEIGIWPARFVLPVSFAILVLACLLRLARLVAGARSAKLRAQQSEIDASKDLSF